MKYLKEHDSENEEEEELRHKKERHHSITFGADGAHDISTNKDKLDLIHEKMDTFFKVF